MFLQNFVLFLISFILIPFVCFIIFFLFTKFSFFEKENRNHFVRIIGLIIMFLMMFTSFSMGYNEIKNNIEINKFVESCGTTYYQALKIQKEFKQDFKNEIIKNCKEYKEKYINMKKLINILNENK